MGWGQEGCCEDTLRQGEKAAPGLSVSGKEAKKGAQEEKLDDRENSASDGSGLIHVLLLKIPIFIPHFHV